MDVAYYLRLLLCSIELEFVQYDFEDLDQFVTDVEMDLRASVSDYEAFVDLGQDCGNKELENIVDKGSAYKARALIDVLHYTRYVVLELAERRPLVLVRVEELLVAFVEMFLFLFTDLLEIVLLADHEAGVG